MTRYANISISLKKTRELFPYKRAVVYPADRDKNGRVTYSQLNFFQLDLLSDRLAFGFEEIGIIRGTRTILMVSPGIDFFIIIFAMFKMGAIPVVVDPGMGIERMIQCFEQSKPKAFIGIEKAHLLRCLRPQFFKSVKHWITVGKRWFWGGYTLDQLMVEKNKPFPKADTTWNETAAIVFTTGSTGPAKGVIYTHGNFEAQIKQIQTHFQIGHDEIDLPTFPLFALFDPALGMTAVIPDMDPTKPAKVNPIKIIEAIENHGVTNMFASPALLNRVGEYGKQNKIKLPSLRRVISAGAPVPSAFIEQFSDMLAKNVQIQTPYGATEAVPITSIGSHEILYETRQLSEKGFGTCIGHPINDTEIKIIQISDESISELQDCHLVETRQVGEIIVKHELVTHNYFNNRQADLLNKIPSKDGTVWHRMGDLAWQDSKGRLWFCGRKSHRVTMENKTLFTIPIEAIFNNHAKVFRSALTGVGPKHRQIPVIFIEPVSKEVHSKELIMELRILAKSHILTTKIEHIFVLNALPVDIRHNSKIFREQLSVIAAKKLKMT